MAYGFQVERERAKKKTQKYYSKLDEKFKHSNKALVHLIQQSINYLNFHLQYTGKR